MSVDWITVLAQIVNFLVLIWLLKRYLYRPILNGIDAREAEIAERMFAATRAEEKAQATETEYIEQLATLRANEMAMTDSARQKAEAARDVLLADAQELFEKERADWKKHLELEGHKYIDDLHKSGTNALLSLTRKALDDLADETLEERIVAHVATRLVPMSDELLKAASGATEAIATTRDPLPDAARECLIADLQNILPDIALRFETDTTQSPGLVLRIGGAQVAWTIDTYIDGLAAILDDHVAIGPHMEEQSDGY
ncbi:MAG: F0F1 ATP synthase subunit B [Rhodobacteraceae bacterium]|nr:MAG: F0F1 ATP synthase subunit B [Paracoccaceae bacterium]